MSKDLRVADPDALELEEIDKPLVNDGQVVRPSDVAPPDAIEGIFCGAGPRTRAALNPLDSRSQEDLD